MSTNSFIVINTGKKNALGLYNLELHGFQNKNHLGKIIINSGSPNKQDKAYFRTVPESLVHQGELEPCPEGEFDLGILEWAGKNPDGTMNVRDYNTKFQEIDSPIWQVIFRKRAIGFHLDGNRTYAPGSAGCLVFPSMTELKQFTNWHFGYGPFTKCYVDWNRGYVKRPKDLVIK